MNNFSNHFHQLVRVAFFILLLTPSVSFSQDSELILGYKEQLKVAIHDTTKVGILINLIDNIYDPDVWVPYNDSVLAITQRNLPHKDKEIEFTFKKMRGYALNNKGFEVEYKGNRILAISYYQEALALQKSIGWKKGMSAGYNNIGSILYDQGEYDKALKYYRQSLAIKKELGYKKGIAWSYLNLGSVAEKLKQNDSALGFYQKAYELHKSIGSLDGVAATAHNYGSILLSVTGDKVEAMKKFRESLANYLKIDEKTGIAWQMGVIGINLFREGKLDSALYYNHEALLIAEKVNYQVGIIAVSENLVEIYQSLGKYQKAFEYKLMQVSAHDSLQNNRVQQEILKKEMQFVHNQEKLEIEKEQEKRELINQAKSKQQQIIIIATLVGLFVVVGFLIVLFQRFKKEKLQKEEIAKQKGEIEDKNTEIIDSITYAKRIQQAILNGEEFESKNLPEHFILFKPKDIVSGDFYWVHEHQETLYMAVADCTGHGVPGALMSMLGISLLNDIVNDNPNISPSNLLDQLRTRVIKELSQDEHNSESRDGMDISLIKLNIKTREVEWSGANNPLWILRNGAAEIEEIKPNKQPISHYVKMDSFTNHSVNLRKGDLLYLFSDGYADQFGGLKGKKLKYPVFKKLMIKNCNEKMDIQKLLLSKYIENWSRDFTQVDDICVFGIRV